MPNVAATKAGQINAWVFQSSGWNRGSGHASMSLPLLRVELQIYLQHSSYSYMYVLYIYFYPYGCHISQLFWTRCLCRVSP